MNKFGSELVKSSVFKRNEEKTATPQQQERKPRVASGKKYTKMLEGLS